ncbi:OsmC family protein [Taibaiella chishuiensis]|uniref:Putative redox protein n=1 Tax=Taibaiella chishuiensis TaxID=1434707 RepID=A0A2P8D0G3_9BACT|nr:OsmC family protein [Taibaiella chishuiensis]PSK90710.1 putative redox protein [Taibaiella chishuiensis]
MPSIHIKYHIAERTFTATDENGNDVNFQSVPDGVERPRLDAVSTGVRPMQGVIMSLGTCSGIDIVSILEKQRQVFDSFEMDIDAEREQDKVPALWTKAHIRFRFTGALDADKAQRAAALSIDKYCSVAETLRRAGCTITYEVNL